MSQNMLDAAALTGVYGVLTKCSLYDIPLEDSCVSGVVCSGVFTHGHVGGEAFGELCRITEPGGAIAITQRLDLESHFDPHAERLVAEGKWSMVERSDPELMHPDRDDTQQVIKVWRVS